MQNIRSQIKACKQTLIERERYENANLTDFIYGDTIEVIKLAGHGEKYNKYHCKCCFDDPNQVFSSRASAYSHFKSKKHIKTFNKTKEEFLNNNPVDRIEAEIAFLKQIILDDESRNKTT